MDSERATVAESIVTPRVRLNRVTDDSTNGLPPPSARAPSADGGSDSLSPRLCAPSASMSMNRPLQPHVTLDRVSDEPTPEDLEQLARSVAMSGVLGDRDRLDVVAALPRLADIEKATKRHPSNGRRPVE